MINKTLIFLSLAFIFVFASCSEKPCTDDGCPEFVSMIQELDAEFASYEVIPTITTESKDNFVYSLNNCITHLYKDVPLNEQIPRELIIAQAAIETGWGKSRFANEGNNLFGIRTWNKDEPYLLPIPWTKWPGWGVKVYETRCDSVRDYLRILNEVFAFTEFRAARDSGVDDGLVLAEYLTQYASNQNYVELVKEVIKYNIRGEYDI